MTATKNEFENWTNDDLVNEMHDLRVDSSRGFDCFDDMKAVDDELERRNNAAV